MTPGGFQSFVAWRYLMARPRRVSNLALWPAIVYIVAGAGLLISARYGLEPPAHNVFGSEGAQGYYARLFGGAVSVLVGITAALFAIVQRCLGPGRRISRAALWIAFVNLTGGVVSILSALASMLDPQRGVAFYLLMVGGGALVFAKLCAVFGVARSTAASQRRSSRIALWTAVASLMSGLGCVVAAVYLIGPSARSAFYAPMFFGSMAVLIGVIGAGAGVVRVVLAPSRRLGAVTLWLAAASVLGGVACIVVALYVIGAPGPRAFTPEMYYGLLIGGAASLLIGAICAVFCVLRYFFTFFTTVPIGGVWIGTMSLVIVLSVMSGFENDLQGKILGSNAHIQVTKTEPEDRQGEPFTEWKDVEKKIDAVPGVVASMPFVTSEAVIAANNNYATVIIKGIDPVQVGKVTKLVEDVEDHDAAMKRLRPMVEDDVKLPDVAPPGQGSGGTTDPAPTDMPGGADPVDFSGGGEGVTDQAPNDFVAPAGGNEPQDFSEPAKPPAGSGKHVVEIPMGHGPDLGASTVIIEDDGPRESKRTQSLPGILVGRELVKTIHMYTGEEVRVVSPLSDPSNPDATGTPIPFNRDFRVAGIFYTGMYEYDLKFVYVPLDALQEFLDLGDAVDGIEVRITDPDATDDVGAAIEKTLGNGYNVGDWEDWCPSCYAAAREHFGYGYKVRDWKDLNRNLFTALKLEKIAMFLVLAITILVASFSIVGNLIMVVVEKAKEIALLKTLGASDHAVMFLFVTQGFFIGVIGTALGVVWGLGLCKAAATWGLPLNPDVYYIDQLPIHVDSGSVLAIAAAGILISVGATLYPAWVAARLQPSTGLRHD